MIARTMRLLDQWTHSNKIKLETTATYISRLIALIQRMNLVRIFANGTDPKESSHILIRVSDYLGTFLSISLKEFSAL